MITKEKLKNHVAHLKEKHHEVDKLLLEATAHHEENDRVNNLKKQKLHIKDEIVRLEKQIYETD